MKLKGSNHLQFPFELASHSFSDGPGLQEKIFDSLLYQVVQILCELLHENKKMMTITLILYLLMQALCCLGDCGMYHS
jgi:hypothetical protein